jgi:hypothetical protein
MVRQVVSPSMTSQQDPITPDPAADRPLPVHRAFVVQLHETAVVAEGQLTGRVEHVLSGQAAHFDTLDELLAFMARVLTALESPAQ